MPVYILRVCASTGTKLLHSSSHSEPLSIFCWAMRGDRLRGPWGWQHTANVYSRDHFILWFSVSPERKTGSLSFIETNSSVYNILCLMTLNLIKESLASVEKDLKTWTKGKRKILGIQGLMLIDQQKVNRNEEWRQQKHWMMPMGTIQKKHNFQVCIKQ